MNNCKIELELLWFKDFVISATSITPIVPGKLPTDHVSARETIEKIFQTASVKLYVPVFSLSFKDNITFFGTY